MDEYRANDPILSAGEVQHLLEFLLEVPGIAEGEHLSKNQVAAYCEGDLPAADVERIDRHLASCEICTVEIERRLTSPDYAASVLSEGDRPDTQPRPQVTEVYRSQPTPQLDVWVAALRDGGSEEAFRHLFHHFHRRLYCFFSCRGMRADDCDDLVQETFLRFYRRLGAYRGEASIETFISQIAWNVLLQARAQKRDARLVSLDESTSEEQLSSEAVCRGEPDAFSSALAMEQSARLRRAINDLPAQMRRCIELRVEQDLKYREVAEVMQISIDTVKAHFSQARILLRRILSEA